MKKKSFKNCILKTTVWFMFLLFLVSACAIDSVSWIPTVVCLISAGWLCLFAWVNGAMEYQESEEIEQKGEF